MDGNTLCEKSVSNGVTRFKRIIEIDDNHYSYIVERSIDPRGVEHFENSIEVVQKVTSDYTQAIIGMWEGVEMTGNETYGDANHRIEYKDDGTYTYYNRKGESWVLSKNVGNEYNVDGDWLATRWKPTEGADYEYEWWDIESIKDGTMKWSALRETGDDTRFTTTFTWKKIQ